MSTKLRIGLTILAALVVAGGGLALVSYRMTHEKDTTTSQGTQPSKATGQRATQSLRYAALGDSVAAGVGLLHDTDTSACNRTAQAYPRQLADTQGYQLQTFACSGATLAAGVAGPQDVNKLQAAPQIQQLFGQQRPDIITLTVGANDVGWSRFIGSCYATNCNQPAATAAFSQQLIPVEAAYKQALQSIIDHYPNSTPRLVVTDYYHVYPAAASNCGDTAGVDPGEQQWVRQQVMLLNDTIHRAASGFGDKVSFVQIDFTGHELCSSNPWVQGINDKTPFHPTADGQAAIAKQLVAAIKQAK